MKNRETEVGDQRSQRESCSKGDADQGHAPRSPLGRRAVGDDCRSRADAGACNARPNPGEKHQTQGKRRPFGWKRHGISVEGIEDNRPGQAQEQDRSATKTVRHATPDGTEDKLHQREH